MPDFDGIVVDNKKIDKIIYQDLNILYLEEDVHPIKGPIVIQYKKQKYSYGRGTPINIWIQSNIEKYYENKNKNVRAGQRSRMAKN